MERTLEPELMEGLDQADAYARADFAAPNAAFVERLRATFPDLTRGAVVDLGCGPADIPIRLARTLPGLSITAVDGSTAMLDHARRAVRDATLADRIELVGGILPGAVPGGRRFDAVISNSLLHHLTDPAVLWSEVKSLAKPGAAVFIVDLVRPDTREEAGAIVERYSGEERELLKIDFFNSLLAAFTIDEVKAQLSHAGLALEVERTSDRHLAVHGRLA